VVVVVVVVVVEGLAVLWASSCPALRQRSTCSASNRCGHGSDGERFELPTNWVVEQAGRRISVSSRG
jgi:hypothetical protein